MRGILYTLTANPIGMTSQKITAAPTLEQLQAIVGGYIEAVPLFESFGGSPCVAFCNEEGKLIGLPYNDLATGLWHCAIGLEYPLDDALFGNVALIVGDAELIEAL